MSLYIKLAEKLQYISPKLYKERYFKKLKNLNKNNILERNIEPELVWLKDFLHKDSVFIDIGANVGTYLFFLEKKLLSQNIFAFEPNKKLYFRLQRLFPEMHIFRLALSNINTTAEFKIPIINGKEMNSRGTLRINFKEKNEEASQTETVQVIKLDDWAKTENFEKIDFIKIDVEGNEIDTLRGAEHTIKNYKPNLMVEVEQRHHTESIWGIISEIENWGYEAKYLDRSDFQLKNISEDFIKFQNSDEVKNKKNYINNIIFKAKK